MKLPCSWADKTELQAEETGKYEWAKKAQMNSETIVRENYG